MCWLEESPWKRKIFSTSLTMVWPNLTLTLKQNNTLHLQATDQSQEYIFLKCEIIFSSQLFSPGTVRYMSVNAHLGVEQSRRDDLEALGYLLTYFFRGGKLPWMGFHIENTRERFRKIGQCKQLINIHKFCKDMPREFAIYFRYIKTLRFSETPDYNYLRFEHKILFLSLLVIAEHCWEIVCIRETWLRTISLTGLLWRRQLRYLRTLNILPRLQSFLELQTVLVTRYLHHHTLQATSNYPFTGQN